MYAQVEKPKENKGRAVANSVAKKKNNMKQGFGFVDNRLNKKEPILLVYNPRTYIQNPNYHLRSQTRGGQNSTVTLGAGAFAMQGNGTNADANRPGGMRGARTQFPEESFKAGHILNAEFGGSGTSNANLIILTAAGNAAHRAFDQPVKHAIHYLYNILG